MGTLQSLDVGATSLPGGPSTRRAERMRASLAKAIPLAGLGVTLAFAAFYFTIVLALELAWDRRSPSGSPRHDPARSDEPAAEVWKMRRPAEAA